MLRGAAPHAGGIVRAYPPNHGRANRSGIRADLACERRKTTVGFGTDDARLQGDQAAVVGDGRSLPTLTEDNEDAVGNSLARERCPGGSKRDRRAGGRAGSHYIDYF